MRLLEAVVDLFVSGIELQISSYLLLEAFALFFVRSLACVIFL